MCVSGFGRRGKDERGAAGHKERRQAGPEETSGREGGRSHDCQHCAVPGRHVGFCGLQMNHTTSTPVDKTEWLDPKTKTGGPKYLFFRFYQNHSPDNLVT